MKILLTGASGFIGSNLLLALLEKNYSIIGTGLKTEVDVPIELLDLNLESIDYEKLKIDVCFHLAANNDTLDNDLNSMLKSNLINPSNMFLNLQKNGCKKFIYASSTAVYGNQNAPFCEKTVPCPLNPYAYSKLAFEKWATEFGIKTQTIVIGLRYSNVYGPREFHKGKRSSIILQLFNQMKEGKNPRIFENGNQKRDWCYVKDVVNANLKCLTCESSEILNIASGVSVEFNSIVDILNKNIDTNLIPEYFPCSFIDRLQTNTQCNINKSKEILGWEPRYLIEEGIKDYVNYLSLKYQNLE
jgi:ADP-L-glycero-D-manno-heptose 6-epimerase